MGETVRLLVVQISGGAPFGNALVGAAAAKHDRLCSVPLHGLLEAELVAR